MPCSGSNTRLLQLARHLKPELHPQRCIASDSEKAEVLPGVLRTPEEDFNAIRTEFPYLPKYALVGGGLRIAYIDEGPANASVTFFLLHGEPTYSYLFRKVIPPLIAAGHRVIVPDLVGFGRSDKVADPMRYTFVNHLSWLEDFVCHGLDLRGLTFFGHEWGAILGLSLMVKHVDRFHRAAIGNTHLIIPGNRPPWDLLFPGDSIEAESGQDVFLARRVFSPLEVMPEDEFLRPIAGQLPSSTPSDSLHLELETVPEPLFYDTADFEAGQVVHDLSLYGISEQSRNAYNVPFPTKNYKAGMRRFPMIVPRTPDDECIAILRSTRQKLSEFKKPFLTAFAPADPLLNWADRFWQNFVPGAANVSHVRIAHSGHFIQEDQGEELGAVLNDFVARTSRV